MMAHELDWQAEAECRGARRDLFFPEEGELPSPVAIAMCWRCPIRKRCLEWALAHEEEGIWGGLTDSQREEITVRRHRVRCPDCRSDNVGSDGRYEVCLSCGFSWVV
jgi:WhiB family redox-sensing transcriptional regulator